MKNEDKKFKKWLNKLQVESWQIELIISGFVIYGVIGLLEPLDKLSNYANINLQLTNAYGEGSNLNIVIFLSIVILRSAVFYTIFNLILHVVLRALWIGAVGLRYVSGDIEFDQLNFSPKFTDYLKRKIPSYDRYIEGLEKACSVIFAFSFLVIFILFSALLLFSAIIFFTRLLDYFPFYKDSLLSDIIEYIFFFFLILYFIDFISLGRLKRVKNKWFIKCYFPIYLLLSALSLSFVYRPMLYNLLDNKFGKKILLLLLPYLIVLPFITSASFRGHGYIPVSNEKVAKEINIIPSLHYDDKRGDFLINNFSVPSKYVDNDYLEVFLKYDKQDDAYIYQLCPDQKPFKKTGIMTILNAKSFNKNQVEFNKNAINCIAKTFDVYINDSLQNQLEYHYYMHPQNKEIGLLSIIDIKHLSRAKHKLRVSKKTLQKIPFTKKDSVVTKSATIPFWKTTSQ